MPIAAILAAILAEFGTAVLTRAVLAELIAAFGVFRAAVLADAAFGELIVALRAFGTFAITRNGTSTFFITFTASNGRTVQQILSTTLTRPDVAAFLNRCVNLVNGGRPAGAQNPYSNIVLTAQQLVRHYGNRGGGY
jgi:hypothetical protein